MMPASARRPEIIRMFPDYANTVLWLGGPVDYSETGLSAGLVEALESWERSYYGALDTNETFRSSGLEPKFIQEGVRLATLISSEISSGHIIEYLSAKTLNHPVLFQCPGTAANPVAAECFDNLVEAKLQSDRAMKEISKGGPVYAYAPLSDAVFDPHGVSGRSSEIRQRKKWLPAFLRKSR